MVARKIADRDALLARQAAERVQRDGQAPRMRIVPARERHAAQQARAADTVNARTPMGYGDNLRSDRTANPDVTDRPSSVAGVVAQFPKPTDTSKDDPQLRDRHQTRKGWFLMEASRQAVNRARMSRCEAFYDSEQWTEQDAEVLRGRGQNPVVYNEVKPTIDWLIGTERRMRVDHTVLAEDDDPAASDDAATKQKLLKFLDDTNKAGFERSYAANDAFKAGLGWLETGIRGDRSEIPVFVGAVSWRDILWDSHCTRRDLDDCRYQFRVKVVDEDVALACFPDKSEEIKRCVQTGDNLTVFSEYLSGLGLIAGLDQFSALNDALDMTSRPVDMFNTRKRVLLLECWEKVPVARRPGAKGMADPIEFKVRVSIMTEHDTLIEAWSPYKHNRLPFVPVWAYRNARTGLPYSPIWPLIGPQEAMNHRMSKSLFEASANQMEMEADAFDPEIMDLDEIREENNAPDGIAVFARGGLTKVRRVDGQAKAQHQLLLAEQDRQTIRSMSGVTGENRGEKTNSVSGRAVLAKQEQGSLLTMELFDNLLLSRQMEGEITLSLSEQYMVHPLTVRTAGDGGKVDRVKINERQPDGTILNDISARRAHFVVGEQPWKQSYAEAAFESLMDVLAQLSTAAPQVVVSLLDVVFDMHPNLPRKRQLLERIRSVNGQTDPDGKQTPEQMQKQQQAEALAKQKYDAEMGKLQADIKKSRSQGDALDAKALLDRLTAIYEAAQAAQVIVLTPQAAPVTDELLKSAGFVDEAGQGALNGMPIDAMQPAQPPQQPTTPMMQPQAVGGGAQPGPLPPLQQTDGAAVGHLAGIQTARPDGVMQPQ